MDPPVVDPPVVDPPAADPVVTAIGDQTVALDASSIACEFGPCGYAWRLLDGTRLGVHMGDGVALTYRFATGGSKLIELRVTSRCFAGSTNVCASVSTHAVDV
ncbi:MAG TPA: hypothetical protein VMY78_14960 [Solirubrobacteraceae bacterium]|nr:hypothetical protein [Solirubrobacteraceae bacterium]